MYKFKILESLNLLSLNSRSPHEFSEFEFYRASLYVLHRLRHDLDGICEARVAELIYPKNDRYAYCCIEVSFPSKVDFHKLKLRNDVRAKYLCHWHKMYNDHIRSDSIEKIVVVGDEE